MPLRRSTLDTIPAEARHHLVCYEVNEGRQRSDTGLEIANVDWRYCLFRAVGLKGAKFQNSNIPFCRFEHCYLRQSAFVRVDLTGATFVDCNLRDVKFEDCKMWYCTFQNCSINYDEALKSAPLEGSIREKFLKALRLNARSTGDARQADRLLLMEMRADRNEQQDIALAATHWHQSRYTTRDRLRAAKRLSTHWIENLVWGYGVRIHRIVFTALTVIALFALTLWGRQVPFAGALKETAGPLTLTDAIYVSAMAFTTVGFGDITPASVFGKCVMSFLGVVGPALLGLFVAAAYRRIQR